MRTAVPFPGAERVRVTRYSTITSFVFTPGDDPVIVPRLLTDEQVDRARAAFALGRDVTTVDCLDRAIVDSEVDAAVLAHHAQHVESALERERARSLAASAVPDPDDFER